MRLILAASSNQVFVMKVRLPCSSRMKSDVAIDLLLIELAFSSIFFSPGGLMSRLSKLFEFGTSKNFISESIYQFRNKRII